MPGFGVRATARGRRAPRPARGPTYTRHESAIASNARRTCGGATCGRSRNVTLDSPHLALILGPTPIPATSDRGTSERTRRQHDPWFRAISPSSFHECDMDCECMRMLGGMRCLS